ncbi:MAG: AAA family ATPase [Acetobacteraceae bacterium]|nr:AAA family ATPase [Acetobacteraceae bacterium]
MPDDSSKTPMTEEEIQQVRQDVLALLAAEGLTKAAAARDAGIHEATFNAFVNGTYQGDNRRIAASCLRWMRARRDRQRQRATLPAAPAHVETPTAAAITEVLGYAQAAGDMVVVSGPPGIGKTSAACAYAKATPNVWKITGHPMLHAPKPAMEELARMLGMPGSSAIQSLHRAVVHKVRGTGGLIIVDEANHLGAVTLDQLRAIHDEAGVGLALLGNATTLVRIEGGARAAEFAQLFSRVGMRLTSARDHRARLPGDVEAYLDAWGVEDAGARKLLGAIGRKPGALRNVKKALQLAHMVARSETGILTAEHVQLAWRRLAESDAIGGEAA